MLDSILEEQVPKSQQIDFMTIDVEGLDLEVLKSNDWDRFRPEYLVVECLDLSSSASRKDTTREFLSERGYSKVAGCFNSVIFRSEAMG